MTTIFVSTPVWVQVLVDDNRQVISIFRLRCPPTPGSVKIEWMGTLLWGESTGRLSLELLPLRNDRIITPVEIQNLGQDNLYLERFSLSYPIVRCLPMKGFYMDRKNPLLPGKGIEQGQHKGYAGASGFCVEAPSNCQAQARNSYQSHCQSRFLPVWLTD